MSVVAAMRNDATPTAKLDDLEGLVARARTLVPEDGGARRILGLAGPPGSGKSTLGALLVDALRPLAVLVPMDGFHLAQAELVRLGRAERKGAPDTFDAAGFVCLLRRLREVAGDGDGDGDVVYAPAFRRDLEEPIAGAIAVTRRHRLVVTEGNYLLDSGGEWAGVRELLDEAWYLSPAEPTRLERLTQRHVAFGRSHDEALERTLGSDQRNAERVRLGVGRADLVLV